MENWNRNQQDRSSGNCSRNRSVREIDEERRRSGWNPYAGEEEAAMRRENPCGMPQEEMENRWDMRTLPWGDEMEEIMASERDLRMLQSMFPQTARMLLPYIEEACDRMEYDGSMMYDQYPDAETVRRIQEGIWEKTAGQFPVQPEETPDEMLMMQMPGRGPGQNWPNDLIRVLLLQEMHHRRCRHRGCRRPQPPRRPYPPRRPW